MFHRILKICLTTALIMSMTVVTVFADDVSDLTKKKNDAQKEVDNLKNELSYLLVQMDEFEIKMAESSDKIDEVSKNLAASEEKQKQQYQDMKLRIKYMYEDQGTSLVETLITAQDMSEVLNKTEYMQRVYDYDREKLSEIADVSKTIAEQKAELEAEQKELQKAQEDLTNKQSLLYTTMAEQEKKVADFGAQLNQAVAAAAARSAAAAASSSTTKKTTYVSSGNSSVGSAIVDKAFEYLGTPYRSGGASPGGFDCSGFTSYVFGTFGIGLSRASGSQAYGGQDVGSLSNALPGDIICYPGHVGIYIGDGQIIHASVPGDYVKVASANIMTITSIRRYW